jgi:hypothetical protein
VLGGVGGAFYYYSSQGFAPGKVAADPSPDAATPPGSIVPRNDSMVASPMVPPPDSTPPLPTTTRSRDSAAGRAAEDTAATGPTPPDIVGPVDSGGIRLIGLPRGTTVLINEQPITQALTRLPPGPHALAISAPRYNFYSDTIIIRPGQIQELTPQLIPIGAPVPSRRGNARRASAGCDPGPDYNADGTCFDERPKPVNPPFVPLPADAQASLTPSLLWVKVSSEGRTIDIMRLRPSSDPAFERAVRNFVWTVTWHPALKDGAPLEAWTQMLFPPAPSQ